MKSIWVLVVVSAFVAGTLMIGTMDSAEAKKFNVDSFFDVFYDFTLNPDRCEASFLPRVNDDLSDTECIPESDFQVDSFFDVFYDIEETSRTVQTEILSLQLQVDSFFDVFFDVAADGTRNTIEPLTQIFGDPDFDTAYTGPGAAAIDSFFDIFVEIDARDRHFDTEIVAMDLRVSNLEDSPPSASAVDMFIKIEDIEGESTDKDHNSWIDVLSFNYGHSRIVSDPGTGATGDANFQDLVVVKDVDKSSPKIAEAVVSGKSIPLVEFELVRTFSDGGRATYFVYELTNVRVTSYSIGGSGETEDVPVESFSLNFEEFRYVYTEFDESGTSKGEVEATWKVEEGG